MASPSRVIASSTTLQSSRRLPGLDGLRGLAVIRVLAHHFFDHGPFPLASYHLSAPIVSFLRNATFGADMFFVLSGFLITWLLLKEESKTGTLNIVTFYTRRALRILPPAIFCVAALALMGSAGLIQITQWDVFSSMTFIRNCAPHGASFTTGHFWSLAIEEQFYVAWPLMLFLIRSPRVRMTIICAFIICAPFWRELNYMMAGGGMFWNAARTDLHCDPLLVGCALAMARSTSTGMARLRGRMFQTPLMPLICAGVLAALLGGLFDHGVLTHLHLGFLKLSILSAAIALAINYVVEHSDNLLGRMLDHPLLVGLGTISYSLYLGQELAFIDAPSGNVRWAPFPLTLTAMIAMTMVSYYGVERPFNSLRARLKSDRRSSRNHE